MVIKTQAILAKAVRSNWLFATTLLLFTAESSRLALTSRFPMAYDEAYHFGLIRFFGHRLNPIVTSQTASSYKFGAIIQDPSLLYHYLMSFPYRFITLFSKSLEVQVIVLRLINVGLAVAGLVIMRKIMRLIRVPDGLANIILLAFALTPIVTVLSAQMSYDNLLIPATALCLYETIRFTQRLDQGIFDAQRLLLALCLCLFSSLVKFPFVPVFIVITVFVIWRLVAYRQRRGAGQLVTDARKNFETISVGPKLALLTATLLGSFLFLRFYAVNVVKYHNPVPQCNQILPVKDCKQYYSWDSNYNTQRYYKAHPAAAIGILPYSANWLLTNDFDLFGAVMPLDGPYYISLPYYLIVILLSALAVTCALVNFKRILRDNRSLGMLAVASFVYLLFLWGRNYYDYRLLGTVVAVNGRYWVPVLIYIYVFLGLGVWYTFAGTRRPAVMARSALALLVIFSFVYFGGYMQYTSHISPVYGWLSPSNDFDLLPTGSTN